MNYLQTIALIFATYLCVFAEAYFSGIRRLLGAQPDLLPVLAVYCGLTTSLFNLGLTTILGGLLFDAVSANPVGISILPLFVIGFVVHQTRDVILREEVYARFLLGLVGSTVCPFLTVMLLWGTGYNPLIGWGTLWQWIVLGFTGGALTPACFWLFDRVRMALSYSRTSETSFRPDREIKRGRG